MSGVEFSPFELFALALAVTLGVGLLAVWRENTWHGRMETMRAEFGRELRKRDDEIQRLNMRIDALIEFSSRAGVDFHAAGDMNIGGDAVGGSKRA